MDLFDLIVIFFGLLLIGFLWVGNRVWLELFPDPTLKAQSPRPGPASAPDHAWDPHFGPLPDWPHGEPLNVDVWFGFAMWGGVGLGLAAGNAAGAEELRAGLEDGGASWKAMEKLFQGLKDVELATAVALVGVGYLADDEYAELLHYRAAYLRSLAAEPPLLKLYLASEVREMPERITALWSTRVARLYGMAIARRLAGAQPRTFAPAPSDEAQLAMMLERHSDLSQRHIDVLRRMSGLVLDDTVGVDACLFVADACQLGFGIGGVLLDLWRTAEFTVLGEMDAPDPALLQAPPDVPGTEGVTAVMWWILATLSGAVSGHASKDPAATSELRGALEEGGASWGAMEPLWEARKTLAGESGDLFERCAVVHMTDEEFRELLGHRAAFLQTFVTRAEPVALWTTESRNFFDERVAALWPPRVARLYGLAFARHLRGAAPNPPPPGRGEDYVARVLARHPDLSERHLRRVRRFTATTEEGAGPLGLKAGLLTADFFQFVSEVGGEFVDMARTVELSWATDGPESDIAVTPDPPAPAP